MTGLRKEDGLTDGNKRKEQSYDPQAGEPEIYIDGVAIVGSDSPYRAIVEAGQRQHEFNGTFTVGENDDPDKIEIPLAEKRYLTEDELIEKFGVSHEDLRE
jgi:hypothetical protein